MTTGRTKSGGYYTGRRNETERPVIESNVPVPESKTKFGVWKETAEKMKPGDSALVESLSHARALVAALGRVGSNGTVRKVGPNEWRVWCSKETAVSEEREPDPAISRLWR